MGRVGGPDGWTAGGDGSCAVIYDHRHDYVLIPPQITMRGSKMTAAMNRPNVPRTMKASEFKAKCLKLMDEVALTGEEVVITKNGRPTARLVPYREKPKTLFGIGPGQIGNSW